MAVTAVRRSQGVLPEPGFELAGAVAKLQPVIRRAVALSRNSQRKYMLGRKPPLVKDTEALERKNICGLASKVAAYLLAREGFSVEIAYSLSLDHAFVVVDGETIVDAAHKQFELAGEPTDIMVVPSGELASRAKVWVGNDGGNPSQLMKKWQFRTRSFKRIPVRVKKSTFKVGSNIAELANEAYGFALRQPIPALK